MHFLVQKAKYITYSELIPAIFSDLGGFFLNSKNIKLHFFTGYVGGRSYV